METEQKQLGNIVDVLDHCMRHNYPTEVIGRWVWITFDAKPDDDTRADLKAVGFRWSRRRGAWSHSCGHASRPARSYHPRDRYGSVHVTADVIEQLKTA